LFTCFKNQNTITEDTYKQVDIHSLSESMNKKKLNFPINAIMYTRKSSDEWKDE